MAPSEAQKRASAKYHAEHFRTISGRVTVDVYEKLQRYLSADGITANAFITGAIADYIAAHEEQHAVKDGEV